MTERLRVAICGGGIGGLCLAVLLSRHRNIDVQLYEAAAQFKEIGAGVIMWSRTWHIMELMGLAEELAECAHSPPKGDLDVAFDFRRSDQPEGFSFQTVKIPYGCIRFHRAHFLDVLVNHLPPGIANFNKRLVSYHYTTSTSSGPTNITTNSTNSLSGPVILTFADGSSSSCDLLIGADGIKSCIRGQMYKKLAEDTKNDEYLRYIEPVWTGSFGYRGLIPVQQLMETRNGGPHAVVNTPMMYLGKSKHIVSYTISRGTIVNVSTAISHPEREGEKISGEWVVDCSQKELLEAYAGWEPEVMELLRCVANPTKWALHHLLPLPYFVQDRVVLLGDAAHAMSPHQGAGAGQAIEDAFILAGLLSKATPKSYASFVKAYELIRLPAAHNLQKDSHENGLMYHMNSQYGDDYAALGPALSERWKWLDETTIQETLGKAVELGKRLEGERCTRGSGSMIHSDSEAAARAELLHRCSSYTYGSGASRGIRSKAPSRGCNVAIRARL